MFQRVPIRQLPSQDSSGREREQSEWSGEKVLLAMRECVGVVARQSINPQHAYKKDIEATCPSDHQRFVPYVCDVHGTAAMNLATLRFHDPPYRF